MNDIEIQNIEKKQKDKQISIYDLSFNDQEYLLNYFEENKRGI